MMADISNSNTAIGNMKRYFSQIIGTHHKSIIEVNKDPFFWLKDLEAIKHTMRKKYARNAVLLSCFDEVVFISMYLIMLQQCSTGELDMLVCAMVILVSNIVDIAITLIIGRRTNDIIKASNVIAYSVKGILFALMVNMESKDSEFYIGLVLLAIHQLFIANKCQWDYLYGNYTDTFISLTQMLKWVLTMAVFLPIYFFNTEQKQMLIPIASWCNALIALAFMFMFGQRSSLK